MKTKIIYISGSEIFDMRDIRAAFDQVRDALSLGNDTVLFGVPVDQADALATPDTDSVVEKNTVSEFIPTATETPVVPLVSTAFMTASQSDAVAEEPAPQDTDILTDDAANTDAVVPDAPDADIVSPTTDDATTDTMPVVAPAKKTRGRPRATKKAAPVEPIEPAVDVVEPATDVVESAPENKVISILSVLKNKPTDDSITTDNNTETDTTVDIDGTETIVTDDADIDFSDLGIDIEPDIENFDISNETDYVESDTYDATDGIDEPAIDDMESDEISNVHDMISTDEPVAPMEKTLEHLLESMTPLREDMEHEHTDISTDDTDDVADISTDAHTPAFNSTSRRESYDASDATLEKLATEFVEKQNDITTTQKNTGHGKIGKLKNILPFKKAKHDDSGLMGDLFGWAGIAANDEDFTIPGFFTNAAAKK